VKQQLDQLRRLIAIHGGIPDETTEERQKFDVLFSDFSWSFDAKKSNEEACQRFGEFSKQIAELKYNTLPAQMTPLRGRVYKAFLRLGRMDPELYVKLSTSKSEQYSMYGNEAARTFSSHQTKNTFLFRKRIADAQVVRLMNAFDMKRRMSKRDYSQGITNLSGILLYCMSEIEAFYCFDRIMTKILPMNLLNQNQEGKERFVEVCTMLQLYMNMFSKDFEGVSFSRLTLNDFRMWVAPHYYGFALQEQDFLQCLRLMDFYMAFGFFMFPLVILGMIKEQLPELTKVREDSSKLRMALLQMRISDTQLIVKSAVDFFMRLPDQDKRTLKTIYLTDRT